MSRKWFRFSLLLGWVLCPAAFVAFYAEKPSLPAELRGYLDARLQGPATGRDELLFWFLLLMLAVAAAATVGLYKFKRWARPLWLWLTVASYVTFPLFPEPVVAPPATYVFYSLSSALNGFVLALLYFSPVARLFGEGAPESDEVLKDGRPES